MEYDPQLTALALNYSEQIIEIEEEDDERFDKILLVALAKSGYGGITIEEVNWNINHFVTELTDVDVYALPEYGMMLPSIKTSEIQ